MTHRWNGRFCIECEADTSWCDDPPQQGGSMSKMKDIAIEALLEEKAKDWGDPVITHEQIAMVWSGLLLRKLNEDIEPHEVATMMSALKLVRHTINPSNPDSLDDADAYNAINRRCLDEEKQVQLDEMNAVLDETHVQPLSSSFMQEAVDKMFQQEQCDCETCVQARLEVNKRGFVVVPTVESDEDEEIGVATVGENWFEVPLPGFGTGPASPVVPSENEDILFGHLIPGKIVDQDEGPDE